MTKEKSTRTRLNNLITLSDLNVNVIAILHSSPNLIPLLSTNFPYDLTLSFEELLLPKLTNKKGEIPRPQNAWMLFLKDFTAKRKKGYNDNKLRVQDISSLASKSWKEQSREVRQFFEILHISAKEIHGFIFPGYKFSPKRKFKLRFGNDTTTHTKKQSKTKLSENNIQSSLEISTPSFSPSSREFPSSEEIILYNYNSYDNCTNCTTTNNNESEGDGDGMNMNEFFELTYLESNNYYIQ